MTTGVDAQTCKLIVLDRRIASVAEFKQIIGRGTRINEYYNKMYFTIMDFKRATALFADPGFDGDPVQIYEPGPDESAVPPENGPEEFEKEAPSEFKFESSDTEASEGQRRTKYYVDDVAVTVATERVQYLDAAGKLISESLRDYTRKTVQKEFANLTSFLNTWTNAKRKQAILEELALRGVFSRRPSLTLIVVRFFMKYGQ